MKRNAFSTLAGFGALALWALSALCACELKDIPTFQLAGMIFTIAFLMHALRLTVLDNWRQVLQQPKSVWLIGATAVFVNQTAYVYAIKWIPPEQAEVIYYLWPIMALLFAAVFFEKRRSFVPFISCGLGLLGVFFLLNDSKTAFLTGEWFGYFFAFLAAISWMVYSLFVRYSSTIPMEMNGIWCGIAALACFGLHLSLEKTVVPAPYEAGIILFMGLGILSLSLYLWTEGMSKGNFTLLNVLSYLTPLLSVVILILLDKTHYRSSLLIACELIMLGGILSFTVDWAKAKFSPSSSDRLE